MVPYFLRFYGALKSAQKLTDFSKYHIDCISKGDVGLFYLVSLSGCCRGDEPGQDPPPAPQHDGGDGRRGGQGDGQSGTHPLRYPFQLPGPQVLSGVGGHGVAVGCGGDLQDTVELVGGGESGDEGHAEAVDDGLDDHAAHGDDGILQGHGQAQLHEQAPQRPVEGPVLPLQAERLHPAQPQDAAPRRQALGDDGRRRRATDAPVEVFDEPEVQGDVGQGGRRHGDQRRPPVPQSPEHGGSQIVGRHHRQPGEQHPEIVDGDGPDLLGDPQQRRHRLRHRLAAYRHQDAAQGREQDGAGRRLPQPDEVPRAEPLGHEDGEALGKALDGPQGEPVEPIHRPQGRQGVHAQHPAHYGGVHHGIHLLENIPRHQGEGEQEKQPPGTALRVYGQAGLLLGHGLSPICVSGVHYYISIGLFFNRGREKVREINFQG